MKKVIKGWIAKDKPVNIIEDIYWLVASKRGKKDDWHHEAWPPRRVTVTVEVEDETEAAS